VLKGRQDSYLLPLTLILSLVGKRGNHLRRVQQEFFARADASRYTPLQ
jgi:hypothetical protein